MASPRRNSLQIWPLLITNILSHMPHQLLELGRYEQDTRTLFSQRHHLAIYFHLCTHIHASRRLVKINSFELPVSQRAITTFADFPPTA